MAGTGELKKGFWLGLGLALAFLALGLLQAFVFRGVRHDG